MELIFISFTIFILYVIFSWIKTGALPASISVTYYNLKHNWIFIACMLSSAMLLMPSILDASTVNTQFLAFFACVGLLLVGWFPDFKGSGKIPHMIGAAMSGGLSALWCIFNFGWFPVFAIMTLFSLLALTTNKKIFFVELGCLFTVYYCLIFLL